MRVCCGKRGGGGGGKKKTTPTQNGNPRGRVIHSPLLLGTPNLAEGAKAAPGTAARRAVAEEARRSFMASCVRVRFSLRGGEGKERGYKARAGRRRMRGRLMLLMHAGAATS